jgi:hypothetical protein
MVDYTTVPLRRYYAFYTAGFFIFILILAFLERHGLPPRWIGYSFLFLTIFLYATIGVLARTASVSEYYVAGRRVPAIFNGMATGADWMSAASFMGLAGTLYLSGYQGLAYVMGWTGGYVLVALLLAPYLRRFGQFTIPDFLAARYGGNPARLVGVLATVLASFVYVVAQIYGVGLITSRFVGLQFEIGVYVGLAGILVCSFLGGMRAVTWTQVAQYAILIVAYLVPVTILSYQVTGIPVPQLTYGLVLQKVQVLEEKIFAEPAEIEARRIFRERADGYYERILTLPEALDEERLRLAEQIEELKSSNAQMREVVALERERRELPKSSEAAKVYWEKLMREAAQRGADPEHHLTPYPSGGEEVSNTGASQLSQSGLLPDGRYRGPAARADALLHHSQRSRGAHFGFLVPAVHSGALSDGASVRRLCQVRDLLDADRFVDRPTACLGQCLGQDRSGLDRRCEWRRNSATRRTGAQSGCDFARHARNCRFAVCHFWPGRCRCAGGGIVYRRRLAVDHRQRLVARRLLQGLSSRGDHPMAAGGFENAAAGGRRARGHGRFAEAGDDSIDGGVGLLAGRGGLFSSLDSWRLLEKGQCGGRGEWHVDRLAGDPLLHGSCAGGRHPLAWYPGNRHGAVVGYPVDVGRGVGRCRRVRDDCRGQSVFPAAK